MGPQRKRLIAYRARMESVPPGVCPGCVATAWVAQALAAVRSAPDNPYGDDDERISSAILSVLRDRTAQAARVN